MPSQIRNLNFKGCHKLKKLVIADDVAIKGDIDLSNTNITDKNSIYSSYKTTPDGITATPDILKNRLRLKKIFAEIGTDPIIWPDEISETHLTDFEKEVIAKCQEVGNDILANEWVKIKQTYRELIDLERKGEQVKNGIVKDYHYFIHYVGDKIIKLWDKSVEDQKTTDNLKKSVETLTSRITELEKQLRDIKPSEPTKGWDDTTTYLSINENNKNEYLTDKEWGLARFRKLQTLNLQGINKTSYKLENVLPNSLLVLNCSNSQITSLPFLPNSLTTLQCYNTQLTSLPTLPGSLVNLYCYNTRITMLANLPNSLRTLTYYNIPNQDIGFVGYKIGNIKIPGKGLKQNVSQTITKIGFVNIAQSKLTNIQLQLIQPILINPGVGNIADSPLANIRLYVINDTGNYETAYNQKTLSELNQLGRINYGSF